MAILSRIKRVTDPLDEDAKARIFRHVDRIGDQDSPRLYELVQSFLEDTSQDGLQTFRDSDSDSDSDLSENSKVEYSGEEIVRMAASISDPYRNLLLAHVQRAVEAYSGLRSKRKSVFQEKVASLLRELGHDAAVCVSRWSSSAKVTAGTYHFIDVIYTEDDRTAIRYFVDLDFASEFEIARPTRQYARVFQLLPQVFVGKEENLKTIVRESCDAAKRSLKSRGLSLPPWRRSSYLHHKWFGPYTRKVGSSSLGVLADTVNCRSMGFDDAVNTRFVIRT